MRLPLLAALLALPACVSILPESGDLSPRLTLDAGEAGAPTGAPLGATLAIADPRSEAAFNTANVAVQTNPLQYEYLAGAEWTDRAPLLFGLFLERAFENEQRYDAVGDRVALPVADFTLLTDIRAMHLDQTDRRNHAIVAYGARLTDRRGATLGSRIFRAEVPLGSRSNDAAVLALNEAARRAAEETIAWTAPLVRQGLATRDAREAERAGRRGRAEREPGS